MSVGAFLLVLAVFVLVGLYLYAPYLRRSGGMHDDERPDVSVLLAERDRVIGALQELDFDFGLGKIPTEDYPIQRSSLIQRGASILRQLDEIAPQSMLPGPDARAQLEQAALSGRADSGPRAVATTEDDLEEQIAARRRARGQRSAGFCPRCGKAVLVSDRFCPACGKALS